MDTSVNESQIYLFAVYKQCKEHACPCIDQDVDPIPSMKPAKNMYHDEKKKKKKNIYIYIYINFSDQLKFTQKATSSRNSGSSSYICLSSSNYKIPKTVEPMKEENFIH